MHTDAIVTRSKLGLRQEERGELEVLTTGEDRKQSERRVKKPKKGSGVGVTRVAGEVERTDSKLAADAIFEGTLRDRRRLRWRIIGSRASAWSFDNHGDMSHSLVQHDRV